MKLLRKLGVVALALFLELVVLQFGGELIFGRSHGPIMDTRFRRKERLAAYYAHARNPSPENNDAYQEELRLMRQHPNPEGIAFLLLFVVANGGAIYLYLRRNQTHETIPNPL